MLVTVSGEEYEKCLLSSSDYWANTKKGTYGRGLGRTADDPFKPVRTGMLGEMAFSIVCGSPVDFEYKKFGDKHDFLYNEKTIDVKCAMKNYRKCLVYHKSASGKEIELTKDIYVFGYVDEEILGSYAKIMLMGYLNRDEVAKCPIARGLRGKHLNYEVFFNKTKPLEDLLNANNL